MKIGDLNAEWTESLQIAQTPPDLKALDAEVAAWFSGQGGTGVAEERRP